MKNTFILLFLSVCFISPVVAENNKGDLHIRVTGMNNDQGKIIVYVFREQDDIFGKKPYLKHQSEIISGAINIKFKNLAYAQYSIMAFHDENNNENMDHNFMIFPIENFGFSNNWNFSLFSGKPTFKKTSISFSETSGELQIKVK
jgi:uncharacterized protein (DUF2141 family)